MPSHYLNQCWRIVNWALRNKIQWNINRKMAAILSWPQRVKMSFGGISDNATASWNAGSSVHIVTPLVFFVNENNWPSWQPSFSRLHMLVYYLSIVCAQENPRLTYKYLETHWCVLSTVVTDVLVLRYQVISNHSADQECIAFDRFHEKYYT